MFEPRSGVSLLRRSNPGHPAVVGQALPDEHESPAPKSVQRRHKFRQAQPDLHSLSDLFSVELARRTAVNDHLALEER